MRDFLTKVRMMGGLAALVVMATAGCASVHGQVPAFSGDAPLQATKGKETAVLAGGCFWGVDAVYKHVKGVEKVVSGYSGGSEDTARYEMVGTGTTGHAESVRITFDPSKISYAQLLQIYFSVATDPTQLNRQGPDTGTQYRGVIFYTNEDQKKIAEAYIAQLSKAGVYPGPIVTQVVPFKAFYRAEDYHQDYLELHPTQPYIVFNDLPKLRALKKDFPNLYKK